MIESQRLYEFFLQNGVSFFTGVPDSLLKPFLKYIQDNVPAGQHIITANEGLAIGLATGYHFSTGRIPLVYLQNSGLGNIINPLTSLADREIAGIPMLLMIGWRGRPGTPDEPQHIKMGRITASMLDVLEVPYDILEGNEEAVFKIITRAIHTAQANQGPVALLVPGDSFAAYKGKMEEDPYSLLREEVIGKILGQLKGNEIVVCTTGKIGREFYEQNRLAGNKCSEYFLSVGAMGHANHIALAINKYSGGKLIMLDGDGALLMQLGALPTLAHHATNHFVHVVINNGSHESVGGQPTEALFADLCGIASACGYASTVMIDNEEKLREWLDKGLSSQGLQFVEIRTSKQSRNDLGRPGGTPGEWKKDLMAAIRKKN